ncbi:hypothetical protein FTW19_00250 [Terriglobus albidus]|uniref:Uncharacterized protein n=1 Tax=Terriglobus albidus TaxID=1592106 RepID=A0A5B9E2N2_9BACT|nr:hypothetical protein [Terriglobus albidus]QEE26572.1 hypothetical protein FTW19_00250 [Terriglobus albidus]
MRATRIAASLLFCMAEVFATLQAPALAQATQSSGDYTAALPSVEKVKAQLKGADPIDTVARQAAVFTYLQTYITRIVYARHYGGPFTPSEQKLMGDYAQAAYQLSQDFTKTHTPDEVKTFQQLKNRYEVMNALDWIKQLQGQQAADTYKGAEVSLAQSYKQHEERLQQQMKQDQGGGRSSIAGDPVLDPMGMFARAEANGVNDPELRRCLELGSSLDACQGVGAIQGMASILVPFAEKPNANEPPPAAGVVFVGAYQGRAGLASVTFGTDLSGAPVAIVRDCGSLVATTFDGHEYTLRKSSGSVQLVLANEPNPIVITLQPDGSISGPGSVLVKGRIITGYTTTTKTVMVDGAPAGPQGYYCNGPCSSSSSVPNYAPKIERCTLGSMAFTAPKPVAVPKTGIGFVDAMTTSAPAVTGFRMAGRYLGNSGLTLEFENDAVILDCGRAHAKSPYVVENEPTGFVVRVQNGGGAFPLSVAPDNTLRGSGATSVNGKLVASIRGDIVNFTPHSENCNVGTFSAKSKRNTMRASSAPIPAVPPDSSSVAASAVTPVAQASPGAASVGAADRAADQRVAFRVLLGSSFSGTNPLAGQTVFVMRKPIGSVLRELGVSVPANASPGEAMKSLQTLCHSPQGCTSAVQGMSRYYVTATKLDASGKATLSAHTETGTYFFFAIVPNPGGSLVWDIAANLAAGDNQVMFSTENAQEIH